MYVAEALIERREAKRPTVLLVEDEPIVRLDLASELRGARYEVIEASNADDALEVLHSHPVDLARPRSHPGTRTRLCDLDIMLRCIEACADGAGNLAIHANGKPALQSTQLIVVHKLKLR